MKRGWISAYAKNISSHGMLVHTGRSLLPVGDVVELAGPAAWKLESKTGLPKAVIVHSKQGTTGLMFTTCREKIPTAEGNDLIEQKELGAR